MATLRNNSPLFRTSSHSLEDVENYNAQQMGDLRRGWESGRIGTNVNSALAGLATARADENTAEAALLEQQANGLRQRQGMYAPRFDKVEDAWASGPGGMADWAQGAVGQGVASMLDPVAAAAAAATVGGVLRAVPYKPVQALGAGLQGVGSFAAPFAVNQPQLKGEFYGKALEDKAFMESMTPQEINRIAEMVGAGNAAMDSIIPGIIGRGLGGAGFRAGLSKMSPGTKTLGGMAMEGATETGQGEVGRQVLGYYNPQRDTSGDASDRLNEFAAGAIGSGPLTAAGAYADAGFRRAGATYDGTADLVKEKAGQVVDMYDGSRVQQGVDAGVEKAKGLFNFGKEKIVDLRSGDLKAEDIKKAFREKTKGAFDSMEQAVEEYGVLSGDPALNLDPQDPDFETKFRAEETRRANLVADKLEAMAETDPKAAELLHKTFGEGVSPEEQRVAVDEAAQYVVDQSNVGQLIAKAERGGSVAGKVAGYAGKLAGRVGKTAWDAAVGAAKGFNEGRKQNQQTWTSEEADAELASRSEAGGKALSMERAKNFSDQMEGQRQSLIRAKNFAAYLEDGVRSREMLYRNIPGANIDSLSQYIGDVGYEIADLADQWAPFMDQRPKQDANKPAASQGGPQSLLQTDAPNFQALTLSLNRIANDLNGAFGKDAISELRSLSGMASPESVPFFQFLEEQLAVVQSKQGARETARIRRQSQDELVRAMPPEVNNKLLRDGININKPEGRRTLLGMVEAIYTGRAARGFDKELAKVIGQDTLDKMVELLDAQAKEFSAEYINDADVALGENGLEMTEDGDVVESTSRESNMIEKQAQRAVDTRSGSKLYGFYGMDKPRTDKNRDPFRSDKRVTTAQLKAWDDHVSQRKAEGMAPDYDLDPRDTGRPRLIPLDTAPEDGKSLPGDRQIKLMEKRLKVDRNPEHMLKLLKEEGNTKGAALTEQKMAKAAAGDADAQAWLDDRVEGFFLTRAGSWRTGIKPAADVIAERKMRPTQVMSLYRDYMRQEASRNEKSAATASANNSDQDVINYYRESAEYYNYEAKTAGQALLDMMDQEKTSADGVSRTMRLTAKQRRLSRERSNEYFQNNGMVIAERMSDRDPNVLSAEDILDLHQKGTRAVDVSRRDPAALNNYSVLTFASDLAASSKTDKKEIHVRASDLVYLARERRMMSEPLDFNSNESRISNKDKDEQYLRDLLDGIGMMIASGHVDGLPQAYSKTGAPVAFDGSIPADLMLATKSYGDAQYGKRKKLEGIVRQAKIFGPADPRSIEGNRERKSDNDPRGTRDEVFVPDARMEQEPSGYTRKTALSRDEMHHYSGLKTPIARKAYLNQLRKKHGKEWSRALDADGAGGAMFADYDNLNSPTSDAKSVTDPNTGIPKVTKRSTPIVDNRTSMKPSEAAVDTEAGMAKLRRKKIKPANATPLDLADNQKPGEINDEFTEQRRQSVMEGATSLGVSSMAYKKGRMDTQGVLLGKKLADELRVDPASGAEQVLNWMRLAAAPAYSKNGVVGGLHLAMPAAVALNKDTMLSYSPDDLQQLVTMRKDLALIIKNSDAPKTTKIKLMQAMAPEAEAGKINMFNYQKILEGIKGEKPALGRMDQSTSTKAEINAASDKALAAYDGAVKKSAPKPAVAADAPVPVLPKKKPASAKEAGAPVGKPQSGTGSGKTIVGDLWAQDGVKVVSTNLGGVHGRGLAKQAKDMGFVTAKNVDFDSSPLDKGVITLAVKGRAPETAKVAGRAFSEQVVGGNLDLLKSEMRKLIKHARANPDTNFYLPFVGLGFGEGNPTDIMPVLQFAASEPNIYLVSKDQATVDKYAASFAPGVRRDATTRASTVSMPMNYRDGTNGMAMRPEYKGKSTMDLIREGKRTATTGTLSRFNGLEVGDIFTVVGADGEQIRVRATTAPQRVSEITPETWSKREGWDPKEYSRYKSAWQMQYELASAPPPGSGKTIVGDLQAPTTSADYTNHSGGAIGADSMFDTIGREYGFTRHNHYWHGSKTPQGNTQLTDAQVNEGIGHAKKAAAVLNRPWNDRFASLLGRNWFQVKNATQVIAIAPLIKPGERNAKGFVSKAARTTVDGGTGYAVEMAIANGKELHVFDTKTNQWFVWDGQQFVKSGVPTLAKNYAGIGSRQDGGRMTPKSVQAIRDVFAKAASSQASAPQRKLNAQVATKLATSTEIARQLGFKAAPPQLADVSAKLLTDPNINPEQFIKETALGLSHLLSSGIYGEDIAKALSAPQWAPMLNGLINEGKANGLTTPKAIVEARRLIVEQALRKELADRSKAEQTFVGRLTKLVKDFISRFKGVMESAEFADIVRNSLNDLVAKTAGPIDLQAGFKKVSFQEAVDADPEAASILAHLSKNPNFVLTGSIVLAANGSVYRNSANMLHDLDFVVNGTVEAAEAHMRKMFPDAVVQNSFKTNLSETFSYIVPPPGAQVVDMEYKTTPGGSRLLDSYRIVKDGKEIGRRYVSPARGEVKLGNAGTFVDFFINSKLEGAQSTVTFQTGGKSYNIATAPVGHVFDAKLGIGREKDIVDYVNYVPVHGRKLNAQSARIHGDLGRPGFPATHDSPIRHEGKFNWREHQGKGEGAAAFGAGTYLSTADGVHQSYKKQFTAQIEGDDVQSSASILASVFGTANVTEAMKQAELKSIDDEIARLQKELKNATDDREIDAIDINLDYWRSVRGEIAQAVVGRPAYQPNISPTYEVSVDISQEQLLDWNVPLSEQSKFVQKAAAADPVIGSLKEERGQLIKELAGLKQKQQAVWDAKDAYRAAARESKAADPNWTPSQEQESSWRGWREEDTNLFNRISVLNGKIKQLGDLDGAQLYKALARKLGSQTAASDHLQSLGILGHRFDAEAGQNDTHPNYVIYDDSKITTNYVHFNRQDPTDSAPRPATEAEMKAARDFVRKVLGPQIKVDFKDITGYAGEWIEAQNAIEIAKASAPGAMQVTYHEALHAFFSKFAKNNEDVRQVMQALVMNPDLNDRVMALLQDYPAAQQQFRESAEERLAYMFQFWNAGMLDLPGEKATTLFQKLREFFRRVMGRITDSERATAILEAFRDGKLAGDPSAAGNVIAAALAKGTWTTRNLRKVDTLLQKARGLVLPAQTILNTSDSPTARKLGVMFWTNPGEAEHGTEGEGYLNARLRHATQYKNRLNDAISGLSDRDLNEVAKYLQMEQDNLNEIAYKPARDAAKKIRSLLQRFRQYMVEDSGVEMGDLGPFYFPRVWNTDAMQHNKDEFIGMLMNKYDSVLQQGADSSKGQLTKEEVATRIYNKIVLHGIAKDHLPPERDDGVLSPFFSQKENREMAWLQSVDAEPFLEKHIITTLTQYFHNGSRSAEYTRRFGNEGEKLESMLKDVHKELVEHTQGKEFKRDYDTPEKRKAWIDRQMAQVHKSVGAMEGTLGKDISDLWRDTSTWATVYQNIRLLPFTLFASVVDPLGMVARGAPMHEAFDTFMRGMKEVFRSWKGLVSDNNDSRSLDKWEQLARDAGIIDAAMFAHFVSDEYSSVYMSKRAKTVNDKFFQLNGMEGWNRGVRAGATKSAVMFLQRHKNLPDVHSARWLKELGLEPSDIVLDNDGQLITDWRAMSQQQGISEEKAKQNIGKVHYALSRWVHGAIITPNAAQRPGWSSDPHWSMFFHLKQFMYSFHMTILKRAVNEMGQGNMAPIAAFMWYVPVMIASDIMKGLIQGGGELPPHMKGMDPGDWVLHGIERAGLLGVGTIGVDAGQDIFSLGGPMVEQIIDGFSQPLNEMTLKALPANPLYRNWVD